MNLLSNVLPGLRDLRTPLAVGYLWILVGFLFWPTIPPGEVTQLIDKRLTEATQLLGGPPSLLLASGLIAYMLGILLGAIGNAFAGSIRVIVAILMVATIFGYVEQLFPLIVAIMAALGLLWANGKYRRSARSARAFRLISDTLDEAGYSILRLIFIVLWSDEHRKRRRRLELLGQNVDSFIGRNHDINRKLVDSMSIKDLRDVWDILIQKRPWVDLFEGDDGRAWSDGQIQAARRELEKDPTDSGPARGALSTLMQVSPHVRRELYSTLLDLSERDRVLQAELNDLPGRLRDAKPAIYETWDRHVAESEFRKGIAGPILFLGPAVVFSVLVPDGNWSRYFGDYFPISLPATDSVLVGFVVTLGVSVLLFIQGSERASEADNVLLSCLRSGMLPFAQADLNSIEGLAMKFRRRVRTSNGLALFRGQGL